VLYLFAIVGVVALTTVFWRAFGPESTGATGTRVLGPDDDPEFLRRLDSGASGRPHSGTSEGTTENDPTPPHD
jgi:hypothetical protein